MKKTYNIFLAGSALMLGSYQGSAAVTENKDLNKEPTEITTQEQKELQQLSEAFGHFIGRNLSAPGIKFDLELLIKGIRDGAQGKPAPMDDAEYEKLLNKYLAKAYTEVSSDNLKKANAFMAENSKKPDVKEIEPGKLQYQILEKGSGPAVKEDGTPLIHYTGKYLDGKVFDDSRARGNPVAIPIQNTIPGFRKGIVGMQEGEKRRLFVHPDLGYGTSGSLPPNSLLIFDIEVLKAENPKKETEKKEDKKDETSKDEDQDLEHDEAELDDDDFHLPQW